MTFKKLTKRNLVFSLLIISILSLFSLLKNSSAAKPCCYHECKSTDPPKCSGNVIQVCGNCDTDRYNDWCNSTDCSTLSQVCLQGVCQIAALACTDNDHDGYGNPASIACTHSQLDCDDSKSFIHPVNTEICDNYDNNCNGQIDENCDKDDDNYCDCEQPFAFGSNLTAVCSGTNTTNNFWWASTCDCNDNNQAINRGVSENCSNSIDDDCDNQIDCADTNCAGNPACCVPSKTCADYPSQCGINLSDGCANILNCSGNCVAPKVCNASGKCVADCIPDNCNGVCPSGCVSADDPDCTGTGCCGDGNCDTGETSVTCSDCIATGNIKLATKYSTGEVFLISDENWQDALSLVSLTTWNDGGTVKKYPTLIYHQSSGAAVVNNGDMFSSGNIDSLTVSQGGKIYAGSTVDAHLSYYDPFTKTITELGKAVTDVAPFLYFDSLATYSDGKIYGGVYNSNINEGRLIVYDTAKSWKPGSGINNNPRDLGTVVVGKRYIEDLVVLNNKIYGSAFLPGSSLFVYDPSQPWNPGNGAGNNPRDLGDPLGGGNIGSLTVGIDNKIYGGSNSSNRMFIYNPAQPWNPGFTPINNPYIKNNIIGSESRISSITTGNDGKIYLGTGLNAHLFIYDPIADSSIDKGQVIAGETYVAGLTTGVDGKIYGGTINNDYIFVYSPSANTLTNLGQSNAAGDHPNDIIAGLNGMIYAGGANLYSYTPGSLAFDADSTIHFIQLYNTNKLTIIGNTSQDLDNLLIAARPIGAGLNLGQISRISTADYFSYWSNYDDIVYTQNNYQLSLLASVYASQKNAPLVISGSSLDAPSVFNGKNVIRVGAVGCPAGAASCVQFANVTALQQEYINLTNTKKVILTNPNDLDFDIGQIFTAERTGNIINKPFTKESLSAATLAAGKQELIIFADLPVITSVNANCNDAVITNNINTIDNLVQTKTNALFPSAPEYLTIVAFPWAIPDSQPGDCDHKLPVDWRYGSFDNISPLMKVGRIYGLSVADVSSYIARSLFYNDLVSNIYGGGYKGMVLAGSPPATCDAASEILNKTKAAGYNTICYDGFFTINGCNDGITPNSEMQQRQFITFCDHGNPDEWLGQKKSSQIPWLDLPYSVAVACQTNNYWNPTLGGVETFGVNFLRKGGIGYHGAVEVLGSTAYVERETIKRLTGPARISLGELHNQLQNFYDSDPWGGWGNKVIQTDYLLLGDPTLTPVFKQVTW